MDRTNSFLLSEKIIIEPDLGDQRQSTFKALPAPPTTPKRVMFKYRFSAIFPFFFAISSFVLALMIILAGGNGRFEGQFLIALNTSSLGQNIIKFEKANAASVAATATITQSNSPFDALNLSFSGGMLNANNPANPSHDMSDKLNSLIGNLTDIVNDGLGDTVNKVVKGVVEDAGIKNFYYLYPQYVCSITVSNVTDAQVHRKTVKVCEEWTKTEQSLSTLTTSLSASLTIGQTRISIPILTHLFTSASSILTALSIARKATLAFLIISLVGAIMSAISALPAIVFPHSRLLIYANIAWLVLAATFSFLAAIILTILVVALSWILGGIGSTVGLGMQGGSWTILFVWLIWMGVALPSVYWSVIWFVEVRQTSLLRRRRREEEVGCWRGIWKEVRRDWRGVKDI